MVLESGWQIGIFRNDVHPDDFNEDSTTEEEERAVLEFAGLKGEEFIEPGIWLAAIPPEWARQADINGQPHEITGPDGRKWIIEIPLP